MGSSAHANGACRSDVVQKGRGGSRSLVLLGKVDLPAVLMMVSWSSDSVHRFSEARSAAAGDRTSADFIGGRMGQAVTVAAAASPLQ
jgi:hypothetical protein